jgi:hypothetical protein
MLTACCVSALLPIHGRDGQGLLEWERWGNAEQRGWVKGTSYVFNWIIYLLSLSVLSFSGDGRSLTHNVNAPTHRLLNIVLSPSEAHIYFEEIFHCIYDIIVVNLSIQYIYIYISVVIIFLSYNYLIILTS